MIGEADMDNNIQAMKEKLYITEFESLHLKSKLDKVLHTVDVLNDDVADLEQANKSKDKMIETLRQQLNQMMANREMSLRNLAKTPTKEELAAPIVVGPPKRLWGPPEVRALAMQEQPPAAEAPVPKQEPPKPTEMEEKRKRSASLTAPKRTNNPFSSIRGTGSIFSPALPKASGSIREGSKPKSRSTSPLTPRVTLTSNTRGRAGSIRTSTTARTRSHSVSQHQKPVMWTSVLRNIFA